MRTAVLCFLLLVVLPGPVLAGGLFGGSASGQDTAPLEIDAANSLEWRRDEGRIVASGDAFARRGTLTVTGDVLIADYIEAAGGGFEVTRVTATGNVHIISGENEVFGDEVIYDLAAGEAVVTGTRRTPELRTPTNIVTATEKLEYREAEQLAIATGDAKLVRQAEPGAEPQIIIADRMEARFAAAPAGKQEIRDMRADGNVVMTSGEDVLEGERATWNMATNLATVTGNVVITRGENVLTGAQAEFDLDSGVSTLSAGGPGGGRVSGLLMPASARDGGTRDDGPGDDSARDNSPRNGSATTTN